MNACEKKELKAVLQKLSDKLQGKMVGGEGEKVIQAKAKSISVSQDSISFSCPYPDRNDNVRYVRCNIFLNNLLKNLPGYADLYNDTITNITFSNNLESIPMPKDKASSTYSKDSYNSLAKNVYTIDVTITTSTNEPKIYHMIGSRIEPFSPSSSGDVGYCVKGIDGVIVTNDGSTTCYSNVFDPYTSQMVLSWFSQEPKLFPETVSIDFPQNKSK